MFKVETNINLIDEHYIISGAVCLVNCRGISNSMGLTSHKSAKIREKYNIRFLSANVFVSLYIYIYKLFFFLNIIQYAFHDQTKILRETRGKNIKLKFSEYKILV